MDRAMQAGARRELPKHPDVLQSAPPFALAEQDAEAVDGGSTHKPGPRGGKERVAVPVKSVAGATLTSNAWATVCPPLAVLGSDDDMASTFGSSLLPPHLLVHPHGFRILKNASALERNMRSYFRLPQPPNTATREERRRLRRTLQRIESEEAQQKARVVGNQDGVVLDGFLLLSACEAEDPEEVTHVVLQSSQLSSSIAEDLQYFTHLTTVDLSDNLLRLGHVLPLPGLEVVHLVCNNIFSLAEVSQSSSSSRATIVALDLAYNHIPADHLVHLKAFGALQQLDLSHNGLRTLPRNLSGLACLTHFALESNELSSPDVFYALGTMPALVEVNLSRNRLSSVPPLDTGVCDGDSGPRHAPFPSLQVMSLTGNRFRHVEALRPLAALHQTLRRVDVGENPLVDRRPNQKAELQRALDEAVVEAYYAALPLPQTNSVDPGTLPEMMDTWHRQSWARYIPKPVGEADMSETEVAGAASIGASSSHKTIPSAPLAAVSNILETLEPDCPMSEDTHRREGVSPPLPTVEEYFYCYRIHVQTPRTTPPPLPKQPTRYFYSSAFRETEPSAHDTVPLVTLPPYTEFMDVYRAHDRCRSRSRGGGGVRRSAAARRTVAQWGPPPQPLRLPMLPRAPTPLRTEGAASPHQMSDEEAAEEAESVQDGKGFFLTSLDGVVGGAAAASQRNVPRDRKATAAAPHSETQPQLADRVASAPAGTVEEPFPCTRLPRSVVSPATANVHAAISELRAMLRKPLPSLPYESLRVKETTG
ncbi:conserved hypothetical protein [Leishmania mexicana MHOM/GT/2001/U1103]|uniref:Leucine-rich repeat protein (LRRP) n=1 Tax=Leishmania mexicana (strain MHOM/GT/2001/U1103) TaxID=929439 RepID=E9B2F1_LEIMU|nr:conserved hypothetical protein [Leishmania mexicana MHOM/GT/2001/U1103]CBZ29414.1 conserved hypothetical protein [Leishmania mexicana MHOM/GT/2001/U1103]